MNRTAVSSSRISSIGWENSTLEVQFHNGAIYQYYGVSYDEYRNFMSSRSLGSELSRLDKRHRYARIV